MEEPRNPEPRPAPQDRRPSPHRPRLPRSVEVPRLLLLPLLAVLVVVVVLEVQASTLVGSTPWTADATARPPAAPAVGDAPGAVAPVPVAPGLAPAPAAVAPVGENRIERAPTEPVVPTPRPRPTPRPVPTPDRAIRPLALIPPPPVLSTAPAPVRKADAPDPDPSTEHAIVVDADSGAVLFQRNAYEPVAPASLTKIMTAVLSLERGDLQDPVKVDVDARTMDGSSVMGLEPWFDVTLEDLVYGLMLPSGNDAALAIGRYVAGSDEAFAGLMNEKARSLGLKCTHFVNPHGLDEPGHYSCPADMVATARYAMQYAEFRRVVAARSYDIRRSNISYTLRNVNPLLGYPGADGVKTGFSDNAGRALVGTAIRDGHRVYVAFMRSPAGAAADGSLLLDWAFESFTWPPPRAGH